MECAAVCEREFRSALGGGWGDRWGGVGGEVDEVKEGDGGGADGVGAKEGVVGFEVGAPEREH